jgi:glutamine amidotransferase
MNVIIDYKVGNLYNLKNALDFSGVENQLVSHADELMEADRILLPGVGAFGPATEHLRNSGMLEALQEKVQAGTPLLGICVGAQLLMDESEEDVSRVGLGWIPGKVKRFQHELKIPQIGWNQVSQQQKDPLFKNVADEMHFYFVHSYHLNPENSEHVLGLSNYGYDFAAAVCKDNLWGVQFHPEKSQNAGLQLLKNFCTLT